MDCKEYQVFKYVKSEILKAKDERTRLAIIREACKKSFLLYIYFVHWELRDILKLEFFKDGPEGKILAYHGKLAQIGQRAADDHEWSIDFSARGFTKSLFFSQLFTEWLVINPEKLRVKEVMKISATGPKSVDELKKIKGTVESNATFISIFGDIRAKPWNEDEIQCTTGVNVKAKGADSQSRGWHCGAVILDDIHTMEEARSKDRRKNVLDWLTFDVIPQMTRQDIFLGIGTNINRNCALSVLANDPQTGKPRPGFVSYNFVAIEHPTEMRNLDILFAEGTPLWGYWSMEALARQRASMGDRAFLSEYFSDPYSDDETVFKPEWITNSFVDESELPDPTSRSTIVSYDPAYTEKDLSDYTGWCVLAISNRERDFGTIYVDAVEQKRMSTGEKVDHILLMENIYRPEAIGIEEVGAQSLASSINYIATKLGRYPNIYPMKAGSKSKLVRAHSVEMLVQNGTVKFIKGKYPEFLNQLLSFKGDASEHDDMVDAFVYALKIAQSWHLPQTPAVEEPQYTKIQRKANARHRGVIHPVTGERMA